MNFLLFFNKLLYKKIKKLFLRKIISMYWTLELAQYLSDAPWPQTR